MSGLRERKKQETRKKILAAALALFQELGFENTTIDRIAEQADVARGTVFLHFPSKEVILAHWTQERMHDLLERSTEWNQPELSCEEKILRIFKIFTIKNREHFDLVRISVRSILTSNTAALHDQEQRRSLRNLFADVLEEGQEQGQLSADVDPIIAASMLENIYLHATYDWVLADGIWPIEEILATKVHYLFGGLNR
ncbi:MAG TPA: TetR/AcrR family transcriptional regulator [Bacilli bacterium]|nr:TetR/AcrR family transcriptional regulator [Bacilli bacterium]